MRHITKGHVIVAVIALVIGFKGMAAMEDNKPAITKTAVESNKWGKR